MYAIKKMNNKPIIRKNGMKLVDISDNVMLYAAEKFENEKSISRSVVYKKVNNEEEEELVFEGFPFCVELTDETVTESDIDVSECKIYDSIEGTLIRVFSVDGVWYTTTNRKLNAFKSKWAAKTESFGQRFATAIRSLIFPVGSDIEDDKEFLTFFYNKFLEHRLKYTFILKASPEERIVCDADEKPSVIHVGTFDENNEIHTDWPIHLFEKETFPFHEERKFESVQELAEYVFEKADYHKIQGLIAFRKDGRIYKIMSKEYQELFEIRNNEPSLKFRYIQLRTEPKEKLEKFFELYPEMMEKANEIEERIYELCKSLHDMYMKVYLQGNKRVEMWAEEKSALQIIHDAYQESRIRTTPTRINDIFTDERYHSRLNKLLRVQIQKKNKAAAAAAATQQ